jgi:hypothetical protein
MLPPTQDRAHPYGRAPPDAAHRARPNRLDRLRQASLSTMAPSKRESGSVKTRARQEAARHGRIGCWTSDSPGGRTPPGQTSPLDLGATAAPRQSRLTLYSCGRY